jgi:outer membrane protein TolC
LYWTINLYLEAFGQLITTLVLINTGRTISTISFFLFISGGFLFYKGLATFFNYKTRDRLMLITIFAACVLHFSVSFYTQSEIYTQIIGSTFTLALAIAYILLIIKEISKTQWHFKTMMVLLVLYILFFLTFMVRLFSILIETSNSLLIDTHLEVIIPGTLLISLLILMAVNFTIIILVQGKIQHDFHVVAKEKESIAVERSAFDSTIFAAAGYERTLTPYESSFSSSSQSRSENLSGQLGVSKLFKTGLKSTLVLDTKWNTDNDLSDNLDPRYRSALILELNQPLLQNSGTSVNTTQLKLSRNRQRQAALDYLLKAQNLILQLEVAATQLAAKTEVIQLRKQSLSLANELFKANQKRFKAGVIPVTDVQQAETEVAARQLSLSLAIQDQNLLKENLNRQLNHRLPNDFKPEALVDFNQSIKQPNLPDFNSLFETAQKERLELKINDFAVQSSSLQQDYLRNQLKPQLDFKLQFGVNGLSGDERSSSLTSEYSGNFLNSFSSMSKADGYQLQAGLEFSMPIGNRSAKSRYHQSELQLKQDQYRQKDLQALIKNDLLQQQINISQATEQLEITERFETLAQTSLDQEQRRLHEGLSDTFRIISFQQKLAEATIDRIIAITRYHLALAQMDFALGHTFERHNIILTNNTEELTLENI